MDLYIYYRVASNQAEALQTQVHKMQISLAKKYSLSVELKRRPEENNGLHTWMEVYRNVPENFDRILSIAVTQAELALLIDGERHLEFFLDLSACA